ncbi:MAG: ABC-type multidrug transport system permease subunit [Verrucomicrobiales bacterium]|jgi:ABC-type multidrug transport system permease subunit
MLSDLLSSMNAQIPPFPQPWLFILGLAAISIGLVVFSIRLPRKTKPPVPLLWIGILVGVGLIPLGFWFGSIYMGVDVKPWMKVKSELPSGFFLDFRAHLDRYMIVINATGSIGAVVSVIALAFGISRAKKKKRAASGKAK